MPPQRAAKAQWKRRPRRPPSPVGFAAAAARAPPRRRRRRVPPAYVDRKSPGLAGFLSIFPGLGHLYLGLYQRAFALRRGAFCILIFFNSHGRMAALSGPGHRVRLVLRDHRRRPAGQGHQPRHGRGKRLRAGSSSSGKAEGTGGLTWGVILVGLGSLWLIDRYVDIDWSFMDRWGGPLALILLGLVLVVSHVRRKRREHEAGVGMPPRSY